MYWFFDETTDTAAGNFAGAGARSPTSPIVGALPDADDNQLAVMAQSQLLF